MRKKIDKIPIIILFLAGLSLLLYPFVANQWNNYRQERLMSNYEQVVAEKEAAGTIDYEAEWTNAVDYKNNLLTSIITDAFEDAEVSENDTVYMSCLNIAGDGIMGIVDIPKIKIRLPIFHGTEKDVLEKAAGHLEGSSLPVGGENTHAVITAHRGLPSAALFTDLDKLKEGDHFLLHILDDTLCYQVDKITVVEPEDTSDLSVVEGKDLVTLLTCTPYGVNSHRMLVRGHRVPYVPGVEDESIPLNNMSLHTNYILWIVVGLLITGIFSFFLYKREKKRGTLKTQSQSAETAVTEEVNIEPGTDTGEKQKE